MNKCVMKKKGHKESTIIIIDDYGAKKDNYNSPLQ